MNPRRAGSEAQDEQQHHRTDHRDDEVANVPVEVGDSPCQEANQESAQKGTDDADDDIFDLSLLAIGAGEHAGHPAWQRLKMVKEIMPNPLSIATLRTTKSGANV